MTNALIITTTTQQLMAKTFDRQAISLPFGRDIFLLETHVAGLAYHQIAQALPDLAAGNSLTLRREPGNTHDPLAIEVLTTGGLKLGYVPRHRNRVLARLMDAGKHLIATLESIGADARYSTDEQPDIRLNISLRD